MAECFNDIEVLWVSRFDYQKDWILSSHSHNDFYQIIYCIDGSCTLALKEQHYLLNPRTVLFLPPKLEHGFFNIQGLKTLDTKFKIHSRKMAAFCKQLPYIIAAGGEDIYEQFESIRENGLTREVLYEENCRLLLAQILIKLLRMTRNEKMKRLSEENFIPPKKLSPLSGRILEYIKNHYREPVDSEALERELHYSYRHLSKIFHREMKMTPVQFVDHYKVLKAKELLKNTGEEIKNISAQLNYSDVHQFSRSFKKIAGIPPAQWRETAWSGICQDVVIHTGFENTLFIERKQ